jgi:hypothetical protein
MTVCSPSNSLTMVSRNFGALIILRIKGWNAHSLYLQFSILLIAAGAVSLMLLI